MDFLVVKFKGILELYVHVIPSMWCSRKHTENSKVEFPNFRSHSRLQTANRSKPVYEDSGQFMKQKLSFIQVICKLLY